MRIYVPAILVKSSKQTARIPSDWLSSYHFRWLLRTERLGGVGSLKLITYGPREPVSAQSPGFRVSLVTQGAAASITDVSTRWQIKVQSHTWTRNETGVFEVDVYLHECNRKDGQTDELASKIGGKFAGNHKTESRISGVKFNTIKYPQLPVLSSHLIQGRDASSVLVRDDGTKVNILTVVALMRKRAISPGVHLFFATLASS
ncbi:hypothetical protein CBL_11634 [Carabus blaptoides fortunei]